MSGHVKGMRIDGDPIPSLRSLEEIKAAREDWIEWEGAVIAAIPLLAPSGRTVRVNITMDERLLARIDAVTGSRSAFLAEAASKALGGGVA